MKPPTALLLLLTLCLATASCLAALWWRVEKESNRVDRVERRLGPGKATTKGKR